MGKPNQFTAKQFIDAIPGTGGIISTIAERVGCAWNTAKKYCTKYPTVRRVWQNEREGILDMAEVAVIKQVKNGEQWAVKFMLATLGKDRGFTEKQEIVSDVVLRVIYDDEKPHDPAA